MKKVRKLINLTLFLLLIILSLTSCDKEEVLFKNIEADVSIIENNNWENEEGVFNIKIKYSFENLSLKQEIIQKMEDKEILDFYVTINIVSYKMVKKLENNMYKYQEKRNTQVFKIDSKLESIVDIEIPRYVFVDDFGYISVKPCVYIINLDGSIYEYYKGGYVDLYYVVDVFNSDVKIFENLDQFRKFTGEYYE